MDFLNCFRAIGTATIEGRIIPNVAVDGGQATPKLYLFCLGKFMGFLNDLKGGAERICKCMGHRSAVPVISYSRVRK